MKQYNIYNMTDMKNMNDMNNMTDLNDQITFQRSQKSAPFTVCKW